ncbi:hypothetical protein GQ43DRAFT_447804 [Delitschia confertaspora ATCC 74209]|uniref:Uncharacterized protein n=1 Tax=Delitschia confertaspora ATCC 74209 TaxID=1513339 RepID=A0A9P4JNR2_9PLEO|nr:hypothetical protein GQ43DRAFT_447804 [Delitschia confertaspora ATCC 74209]
MASPVSSDEEVVADVDEPPDHTPRSTMQLQLAFKNPFTKTNPVQNDRKTSLLTHALLSPTHSPTEEPSENTALSRGMSCASTWSNHSAGSTAELTSDGGLTSPGTRTSSPSPPPPSSTFHGMVPVFTKKPFEQAVSIVPHDDENIGPFQKTPLVKTGEAAVEVSLGRKRCIAFACGQKETPKPTPESSQSDSKTKQMVEPQKRVSTIKFACPNKVSTDAPSQKNKPRRPASPAPMAVRLKSSPKVTPKSHRGSDSTVRNASPVSVRKRRSTASSRRLSANSDLSKTEALRFHEFASSVEEVDEWLQETTIHKSRLTVSDTLQVENKLRQLGQEAEEEALEDEEDELEGDEDDEDDMDEDDEEDDDVYGHGDFSDEGFQTDDEGGLSDEESDESDAENGHWWAPGHSTAATSIEHLEHIRFSVPRSPSESSVGSVSSAARFSRRRTDKTPKPKKTRPVSIRAPSPELPDSTDFVCGTLDEDRPLEAEYLAHMERRRAAKHKVTPQDIDPTFPTSDPELDEEDEDEEPTHVVEESDNHLMMHGQMDQVDDEHRGRRKEIPKKRSPAQSPKRLRSPPPAKRPALRSPPPRRLFGHSPRRLRSPPPSRLRSPPPTRRGSDMEVPKRCAPTVHFAGPAHRHHMTVSSSLPRTPVVARHDEGSDAEDTAGELPTRRAIDIKVGLEQKRLRRRAQLYAKYHRKGCKDKEKRPAPGKGLERMREVGLGLAAHKGKIAGAGLVVPAAVELKDTYILSV